eukprot:6620609-Heterocapsa_arctica.AAC.1
MAVRDRLAINDKADRARHFAMPCSTVTREDSSFDPNIEPTIKWIVRKDKDLPLDTNVRAAYRTLRLRPR